MDPYRIIERYYPKNALKHHVLVHHSEQVRAKALEVVHRKNLLDVDVAFISEAAMLHDIGAFLCHAPLIDCNGVADYIQHGVLGSDLLTLAGFPKHALVCERHTGTGISLLKIIQHRLPLPHRNLQPVSLEEKIICYADKFFSKTELYKTLSISEITQQLMSHGDEQVATFMQWHEQFG